MKDRDTRDIIDIAIIGGGAAGLMCGCIAGRKGGGALNIVIFERNAKTGKKLLATGNGRCNLSNAAVSESSYFADKPASLKENNFHVLDYEAIKSLFKELGLMLKTDSCGRAYPQSGSASSVLDVLRDNLLRFGVTERTEEYIRSIKKEDGRFSVKSDSGEYAARRVILACGSCASPVFGSDGSGFALARSLGHSITPLFPSLAPIFVRENLRSVKGVRCDCRITLKSKSSGDIIAEEAGELQINEDNISGICVFNLSGYVNRAFALKQSPPQISLDLLPEISGRELSSFILKRVFSSPDTPLELLLTGVMNKKLGAFITKSVLNVSPSLSCGNMSKQELLKLSSAIKAFTLTPEKISDFKKAQVTAGGISCDEIDFGSMESKIVEGLYLVGEAVDVSAACGGFNLHWAWSSAVYAAENAASRCYDVKN